MKTIYLVIWTNGARFTYLTEAAARKNMLPNDQLFLLPLNSALSGVVRNEN